MEAFSTLFINDGTAVGESVLISLWFLEFIYVNEHKFFFFLSFRKNASIWWSRVSFVFLRTYKNNMFEAVWHIVVINREEFALNLILSLWSLHDQANIFVYPSLTFCAEERGIFHFRVPNKVYLKFHVALLHLNLIRYITIEIICVKIFFWCIYLAIFRDFRNS